MSVGMECSYYTPEVCDGHYCPRDEDRCPRVDKVLELQEEKES